ncbi:hypothetical protein TIFTF001_050694 [Ficus carica]|uniref:Uncharacterized protein n=1 Tax=Ficus carica TaxID=3494 RepID=A0AA88CQJ7_FICCA|nr:hypothetical protein TIFTF001_050687 [Ficus carica]GMN30795.1 hypothetical protein TIFTF001_050690 [Ficus carica]GMN30810.1 hypothetical protein TIFTF001_050692 [Ficus carica]GMN30833.1 hypothetical protein TIFTF001_050694 [Ficus carica]
MFPKYFTSVISVLMSGVNLISLGSVSHELVPGLPPLRFNDLPFPLTENLRTFAVVVVKTYGSSRKCSAVVLNTINCLEQSTLDQIRQEARVPTFAIGPLHIMTPGISSGLIKEERSCLLWLDKQPRNSVIYVGGSGSIASLSGKEVTETAWELANGKQAFLWVIRPGSVHGLDWNEVLSKGFRDAVGDKGCIVRWAPQKEVLAHPFVGVFWSHCGWNSTIESMAEGVLMICRPCFGDQRVNARYVSHVWGVGLVLEEMKREEIERVVRRLMLDDEGKEMRERAKEWKHKIEASTRKGGSSYDSLHELANFITSL